MLYRPSALIRLFSKCNRIRECGCTSNGQLTGPTSVSPQMTKMDPDCQSLDTVLLVYRLTNFVGERIRPRPARSAVCIPAPQFVSTHDRRIRYDSGHTACARRCTKTLASLRVRPEATRFQVPVSMVN